MTDMHILHIPNINNLRTLAGYESADGRIIKANKLLRSGSLNRLGEPDSSKLATDYGVTTVIDLRMDEEVSLSPDVLPDNTHYYQLPVLPFTDHANFVQLLRRRFSKPENPTVHMYQKMLTDSHANEAYRGMFDLLMDNVNDNESILIHCTAGKDRTGVAAMLIEGALGIPDATIRADYLLSNESLDHANSQYENVENRIETMRLQPASETNVQAILSTIHNEYGSWSKYLQTQLGLSDENLTTLKKIYLN